MDQGVANPRALGPHLMLSEVKGMLQSAYRPGFPVAAAILHPHLQILSKEYFYTLY